MFSELAALHCSICQLAYNLNDRLPRLLPQCGHTFCSACLNHILISTELKCPLDDCIVKYESKFIEAFPINLLAKKLIEENLSHDICEIHNNRKEVICFTDKALVCAHCALFEGHKNHSIKHIMEVKSQLQVQSKELGFSLENLDTYHREAITILEERRQSLQKTIEERFEELNFLLKMKKLGLVQELEMIFQREIKKLNSAMGNNSPLRERILNKMTSYKEMPKNEGLFKILEEDISGFKEHFDKKNLNNQIEVFNKALQKSLLYFNSSLVSQVKKLTEFELTKYQENPQNLENHEKPESLSDDFEQDETITINSTRSGSPYIKINSSLGFETCNGYLDITATSRESTNIIIDIEDWMKIKEIRIKLDKFTLTDEDAKVLEYIWSMLKNIRCIRVDASFQTNLTSENLIMLFTALFFRPEGLKEIELNFNESQLTDESVLYLTEKIFPQIPNLKVISLNFNSTNVTDISISSFAQNALSKWTSLESFIVYIGNLNLSEKAYLDLFIEIPTLGHFELGCSCSKFNDAGLKAFADRTLSSMTMLKRLKVRLWKTDITDEGVAYLFRNMPDLKNFTLDLGSNQLTDLSVQEFVDVKLLNMTALKNFKLYLYDTKVSEQIIAKLYQIKHSLTG